MLPSLIFGRRRLGPLISAADDANRRGDWETARKLYARILAINPLLPDIHVQHGHSLKELGQIKDAEAAYREAIRIRPGVADTHLQLARVLEMAGHRNEALAADEETSGPGVDPQTRSVPTAPTTAERPDGGRVTPGSGTTVSALGSLTPDTLTSPVVSFDLFGTLLRRRHLADHEVHDAVSGYVLALLGLQGREHWSDLTRTRYDATERMKGAPSAATEEPTLLAVWTQLVSPYLDDVEAAGAVARKAAAFEFALDRENLMLVDGAASLLAGLQAAGRNVIGITDMYFDQGEIESLLDRLGVLKHFSRVFVSSEVGLTKQTGNLFLHTIFELKVRPSDIVHVGDNRSSDYLKPISLGWNAVYVEQHDAIAPVRPVYGRRDDIHREVADLLKLFSAVVSLSALNERSEHVYFLTRDGVLAREVMEKWSLPVFTEHLRPHSASDLFMSRAMSCWFNLDFSRDWLSQAINHAIWLRGGRCTVAQIAEVLGVPATEAGGPDEELVGGEHATTLAGAWRAAGLSEGVRQTVLRRRAWLERYLDSEGFFERRRVTVCDVGYSGTAVRDLNAFLLQGAGADRKGPISNFHVIASNRHHEANRLMARPYIVFSGNTLLPAEDLPEDLLASFAWLEYFFKHPKLGPLVGYEERDGRVVAVSAEKPAASELAPFDRVLSEAEASSEDIVLLFMALTSQWKRFTRPLIERFAHPDADTVRQMDAPVYEDDALGRHTRPIVIADAYLSDEQIRDWCRSRDYWIPGSLIASQLARQEDTLGDLDTDFYIAYYEDLRGLPDHAARVAHYRAHGQAEGRFRSHDQMMKTLSAAYGRLPAHFNPVTYLWLNPDVPRHSFPHAHAITHYLTHGRAEGRKFRAELPELEAEFDGMAASGALDLTGEEERRWREGRLTACELVFDRHNVSIGPWLDHLHAREFEALNFEWCGSLANRAEAVLAFLRQGVERVAPLSLRSAFDADFYRSRNHLMHFEDQRAYKHWLEIGSLLYFAPSEAYQLQHLIHRPDFPPAFDWRAYVSRSNGRLDDSHRADVLGDLLAHGDPLDGAGLITRADPADTAAFLGIFAQGAASRGRSDAALKALTRAVDINPADGRLWHVQGDLLRAAGRDAPAVEAYRRGAGTANPDPWTFINGAQLSARTGAFGTAKRFLDEGRRPWKGMSPWRDTLWLVAKLRYEEASAKLDVKSETYVADLAGLAGRLSDELLAEGRRGLQLALDDGPQLVLTGRRRSARLRAGVEAEAVAEQGGRALSIFFEDEAHAFEQALPGASVAVFHDVAPSADVVRAAALATSLGVPTVCWLGEPGVLAEARVDLAPMAWEDPLNDGREGLDPRRLAMVAVVDTAASAFPALLPALERLARPGTSIRLAARPRTEPISFGDADAVRLLLVAPPPDQEGPDAALRRLTGRLLATHPTLRILVADDAGLARGYPGAAHRISYAGTLTPSAATSLSAAVDIVVDLQRSNANQRPWAAAALWGRPTIIGPEWRPEWLGNAAFTAADLDAVEDAATLLITDAARRRDLGRRANHLLARRYLDLAARHRPARRDQRRRVLLANVFFPPQTTGGASRVLADNLDYLKDVADHELSFAVLASDDGNHRAGEVTVGEHRGSPVFRIATPQERNMDWRGFNADVESFMNRVCRIYRPELVHLHAVQRLTLAVPEYCLAHAIPYVITLHDAWWLSDYPFLTDGRGDPVRPRRDPLSQPSLPDVPLAASVERALRTRRVLEGAEALLGVSDSFSELFRQVGYNVRTVPNGASRLSRVQRTPGDGRVRLGHVGGLETHKGAFLIEAVLKTHRFDNLKLTIVDLARDQLDVLKTTWGTTPVTVRGKTPPDQMSALYGELDVLLAPSTWPESYGLVSREALSNGLWVVASAQGAMAEDVTAGANGFRIDAGDPAQLTAVLRSIDADPGRYTSPPDCGYSGRMSDEQGAELLVLYRRLLASSDGRRRSSPEQGFAAETVAE